MDLDMISAMKVEELKNFLRLRGLKLSGRKQELPARVFVAIENNVPIVKTAEEIESEIANDYKAKLIIGDDQLPDPFQLEDGWISEEDGVKLWPTTLYPDIFHFLAFYPSELKSKDLGDYKMTKAYSYYADGWLKPLDYHPVSEESKYCFLKTTCRPSQKISDVPNKLWVCLPKQDGKVLAGHCSCMADVSQTCNHVAATLFRIEAAVRMGLTSPSCTSTACGWLPNNKSVEPTKIKDLKLSRGTFGRRGSKQKELNSSPKKHYNPAKHAESKLTLDEVIAALSMVCNESDSMIFAAVPKNQTRENVVEEGSQGISTLEYFFKTSEKPEEFLLHMEYFPRNISLVEERTRGQSENPLWLTIRKQVITASKAHAIKTRMETYKRKGGIGVDMTSVFLKVSGKASVEPELPALKYSRAMEKEAVKSFKQHFEGSHQNVQLQECGIFLCKDMPFLGGSPDMIISCDCCGKSCLEVKCPFSIRHLSPMDSEAKLPYIRRINDVVSMNYNHKYYTQCQVPMAATNIKQSYFFVWTAHGYFFEKINFDEELWIELKKLFTDFYLNHFVIF